MPDAAPVLVPLISTNEPEARVVALEVGEGSPVEAGAVIAVLENTKAAVDVEAPHGGHVIGLTAAEGDAVMAGDVLCWLAPDAAWRPPASTAPSPAASAGHADVPEGVRISAPALARARALGIDLARLPIGPMVTASMVEGMAGDRPEPERTGWIDADHPTWLIEDAATGGLVVLGPHQVRGAAPGPALVYGGGGHGRQVIDALRGVEGATVALVIDDGLARGEVVAGVAVGGGAEALASARADGIAIAVNAVGAIGAPAVRAAVFDRLADAGFVLPALVHPAAVVEPSASLSPGCQVFARAYVGSAATIRAGAIVNTAAVVSHDCLIGPGANVSPGALLGGGVVVGASALVGMGVTVNVGVDIGAGARIGNGATVKADVPAGGVVRAGTAHPA